MLQTDIVSARILEALDEKGIDSWQAVLKTGEASLVAIDGIGPATAGKLLQAARGLLPAGPEPVGSETLDAEGVPREQEQPTAAVVEEKPGQRPRFVDVKMVPNQRLGQYPVAIVGPYRMVPGDVHRVHVQRYLEALAKYPTGTFVVRYAGEFEYRESL